MLVHEYIHAYKKTHTNISIYINMYAYMYIFLVMPYWLGPCVLRTHIESRFCNPHVVIFAEVTIIIIIMIKLPLLQVAQSW
jgi:hypothetical protein